MAGATSNESDTELLRAAACGDRAALGRLYDEHAPRLLALAVRLLRNPREAEDLVHDVFLEAWRQAGEYDTARGTVRTWLAVRLRSRALDRLKSVGYSRTVALDPAHEPTHDGQPSADVGAGADAELVRRVVANLSDDQRAVLELSYFEGLSLSEVAERLGAPIGTVKSRLARALARLRAELGAGERAE